MTCLGINNEGKMSFTYSHEDIDTISNGDGTSSLVYNGQNSTLWVNFKDAFTSEIREMYQTLRSGNLTYDKLYNQFVTEGSDKWSAAIYNADAQYKYIGLLDNAEQDYNGDGIPDDNSAYLYQVRGSGEDHFKYFIQNRLNYCDSKWLGPNYNNNFVALRIYTPTTWSAIEPNPAITVTAYSDMYTGVKYKANGTLQQQRIYANGTHTFNPPSGENFDATEEEVTNPNYNDTETAIYGASELSSIGDLAPLYCGTIDLTKATRLKELKIGDAAEGYTNPNLHKLSLAANKLLTKIDVRNCPNLTTPLALSGCSNIEEIYASGSGITAVDLPESGYVKILDLPETITTLTLKNQLFLTQLNLPSVNSLTQLYIENCSEVVDAKAILERCLEVKSNIETGGNPYVLQNLRIVDIDLGEVTYEYLETLSKIRGVDSDGNTILPYAYISGSCTVPNITGEQLQKVRTWFPYLVVHYDTLEVTLKYMTEDGSEEISRYTYLFEDDPNTEIDESSTTYSINAKDIYLELTDEEKSKYCTKNSNAQYDYTYGGWSRVPNGMPEADALKNIVSDMTFYVAFNRELRNYTVEFYNGTEIIDTQIGSYLEEVIYSGETPQNNKVATPDAYLFYAWDPAPIVIPPEEGFEDWTLKCYAQYILKSEDNDPTTNLYTFPHTDFDYSLDASKKTISLLRYKGVTYTIGQIPNMYEINGLYYSVTELSSTSTSGQNGFESSDIEIVVLPDGLLKINSEAFNSCGSLLSLTIPPSVTEISTTALNNTPRLEQLIVDPNNKKYFSFGNAIYTHNLDGTATLFRGCKATTLGGNDTPVISTIGNYAFSGCNSLTDFTIPTTVTTLSQQAFTACRNLWVGTTLVLPESLLVCDTMSLYGTGMQNLVFPDSIKKIGQFVTKGCPNLESISLPDLSMHKVEMHQEAFDALAGVDVKKLTKIEIRGTYADNHEIVEAASCWGVTTTGLKVYYTDRPEGVSV